MQRFRRRTRAFVGRTAVAGEARRKGGEVETEMALVLAPPSESTSLAPSSPHRSAGGGGTVGNIDYKDAGLRENERCPGFLSTRSRYGFRPRTIGFAQASISRGRASTLPSGVVRRIPSLPTIGAGVQCATVGGSVAEVSVDGAGLWTLDAREVSPAVIHLCATHCVRSVYFSWAGVYLPFDVGYRFPDSPALAASSRRKFGQDVEGLPHPHGEMVRRQRLHVRERQDARLVNARESEKLSSRRESRDSREIQRSFIG
ncbi:hypothetical protein B0H13DRAFT_1916463 [Mycena leptocephala]|nr:hypothetical protein B0H13DRAFT_1916463 [Mycena leptocephala]